MRDAIARASATVTASSTSARVISPALGEVSSIRAGMRYGLKNGMTDSTTTHCASGSLSPVKAAK